MDSEEEEEEDEDLERASDALLGRDLVRECLEKDPADRNDDDIGQSLRPTKCCDRKTTPQHISIVFNAT